MGTKRRKLNRGQGLDLQIVVREDAGEAMKKLARALRRDAAREHFVKAKRAPIAGAADGRPESSEEEVTARAERHASRNHTLGFATRTRKNLLYIEKARAGGADVHVVTQLITSLLGLVVFPWERRFAEHIGHLVLADLQVQGWPVWRTEGAQCRSLRQLIRLLRHAVAHGNVAFSSDSRQLSEVEVEFTNRPARRPDQFWHATIRADQLRDFCLKFIELVDDIVG